MTMQAALLGSGCWAQMTDDVALAVTTSGCGEYLIKTNLAKEISRQLFNSSCPSTTINKCFNEDFISLFNSLLKVLYNFHIILF